MSGHRLQGRTAIVTGASSGIGRAIAERFGTEGARVFLSGRTRAAMEESKHRIEQAGGRATVSVDDVRDPQQVRDLVVGRERRPARLRQNLRDRRRQRRLAMVHVTNRPNVAVRLRPLKLFLRH